MEELLQIIKAFAVSAVLVAIVNLVAIYFIACKEARNENQFYNADRHYTCWEFVPDVLRDLLFKPKDWGKGIKL